MAAVQEPGAVLTALSNALTSAVERAGQAVVAVHARPRIPASGVLWRDGVVVVADHTVRWEEKLSVTLVGGRTVSATLAGRDPSTDLAALRLDGEVTTPAVERRDGSALKAGHVALALGRPGNELAASLGLVSVSTGEWRTGRGGRIERFIRLDIAIHDGFSGGALVTADGAIAGINTSGLVRGQAITIPGSTVNRVIDQLLAKGRIARGYLGVAVQPVHLSNETVSALGLPGREGLILIDVEPKSPAAEGGLMLGDVVVAIDGHAVRDPAALLAILGPESVGRTVHVQTLRAGAVRDVAIAIRERGKAQ